MASTTKKQRSSEALQLIIDGVPPTDAATQLAQTWVCMARGLDIPGFNCWSMHSKY
ncbi:hypothetical protein N8561_01525 [bacterium]|nr:hypothetical protein [bacterium]